MASNSNRVNKTAENELSSIKLLRWLVNVYDVVTLPIYYAIQRPDQVRAMACCERARRIDHNTWCNVLNDEIPEDSSSVVTVDEMFRRSVCDYGPNPCLGQRKILAVEQPPATSNPNKDFRPTQAKYVLDDQFTWFTYDQVDRMVQHLSIGLLHLPGRSPFAKSKIDQAPIYGQEPVNRDHSDGIDARIIIVADTCMAWFLLAQACFRINVTVVTAYTTLEDAAILHSVNQTEVRTIVVSQKFAARLPRLLAKAPFIENVIILDEPLPGEPDISHTLANTDIPCESPAVSPSQDESHGEHTQKTTRRVNVIPFDQLLNDGQRLTDEAKRSGRTIDYERPTPANIAVLMYTSGSTGLAKGVMLSHQNIVFTAISFSGPGDLNSKDRYIAYLPLGHVLELAAECVFLRNGSTIAYSSHLTLTDHSPAVKRGQRGDAALFKPTIMASVPLILERMRSAISASIASRGKFWSQLYDFLVEYKRYWSNRYYSTPLFNAILCRPIHSILGGKVRAICCGGAALPQEVQEYVRLVMDVVVIQGYGATETSAAASFMDMYDIRYNVVGAPYPLIEIKLEDWDDYKVNDKPNPRGEIIVGGAPVAMGYYKLEEETNQAFYVDPKTKIRYFRTGDIGQIHPDGALQIIDRKKDIVKPLSGEYISLVQVESVLKTAPIVDNICVHCSPYSNYLVALLVINPIELRKLTKQLINDGKIPPQEVLPTGQQANGYRPEATPNNFDYFDERNIDVTRATEHKAVESKVLDILKATAASNKLKRSQVPARIKIVTDEWSAESGLITASFKLRRRQIELFYAKDITQMYKSMGVILPS